MRVAALLPAATDIVIALGAGEQLVAVTHACSLPRSLAALPRVTRSRVASSGASEIDAQVSDLSAAGALVVTFGCMDLGRTRFVPTDQGPGLSGRLRVLDRLTEAVTDRHGGVHVCFLDHPAVGDDMFSADGLHANRRGHALIVTEVLAALRRRLTPVA